MSQQQDENEADDGGSGEDNSCDLDYFETDVLACSSTSITFMFENEPLRLGEFSTTELEGKSLSGGDCPFSSVSCLRHILALVHTAYGYSNFNVNYS